VLGFSFCFCGAAAPWTYPIVGIIDAGVDSTIMILLKGSSCDAAAASCAAKGIKLGFVRLWPRGKYLLGLNRKFLFRVVKLPYKKCTLVPYIESVNFI
jgi:hypothetical protein